MSTSLFWKIVSMTSSFTMAALTISRLDTDLLHAAAKTDEVIAANRFSLDASQSTLAVYL
ncbi:hypothetical protein Cantr_05153 [Candida viswanathii]|uniref:Uncharacterized protein n=1 Tax=Candida viswanathii TaxID=5486 RepID=A0A367XSI7_9ASCO|nr:hypothetical protein Cantr_05153 [Candida viswanathii]